MRTLLAASRGGHLSELVNLRPRLDTDLGAVTWFTPDTPQSRSLLAGEQIVFANPAPPRDWYAAVRNARLAAAMCRRIQFDLAVSTGASIAVSALPSARRSGATTYYLESAARVDGPSLTGRMIAAIPGIATLTQNASWASEKWTYAGSVFDGFEPGPLREMGHLDRVVVTVGSQEGYPFDRMIAALAAVMPAGVDVLWQTGATDPRPFGIEGVVSVPSEQLDDAMAAADLVVSHAGVGSALSALTAGRHPVLVARSSAAGEHVDDHQFQIAEDLSRRGLATVCSPEGLCLDVLISAAQRSVVRRHNAPSMLLAGP